MSKKWKMRRSRSRSRSRSRKRIRGRREEQEQEIEQQDPDLLPMFPDDHKVTQVLRCAGKSHLQQVSNI